MPLDELLNMICAKQSHQREYSKMRYLVKTIIAIVGVGSQFVRSSMQSLFYQLLYETIDCFAFCLGLDRECSMKLRVDSRDELA